MRRQDRIPSPLSLRRLMYQFILQECFCDFRLYYIVIYHKHFRVPEHRAFIHLSRQTSCGNGSSFHISRSNTINTIDRIIQGILLRHLRQYEYGIYPIFYPIRLYARLLIHDSLINSAVSCQSRQ